MRLKLTTLVALAICAAAFESQAQTPPAAVKVAAERAPTNDEELALAALEGLMAQPAERALPIIKKVLAGSQSTLVKQRALFVLSQIDSPEAQQILAQTSRSPDAALRGEAIRASASAATRSPSTPSWMSTTRATRTCSATCCRPG